ncbi:CD99 molecule isoform X2 [Stegastes partitus]|uniref:CD99 molecule isoform X2 n=1 Tax=Stegastes partitus TaxID=144197 RepID=A0A9Y4K6M4_9TELE|nr:PREDICTED: CD99 antigen-like protein 2 isoform X2 [Stegastes partitus]
MKLCFRIVLLLFLVAGTLTDDGFDLFDALDDVAPTPPKPKEQPKTPENPKNDGGLDLLDAFGPDEPEPEKPKKPSSGDSGGLDLLDAFGPDEPQPEKPKKPSSGDSGGFGFDLEDALKPDPNSKPDKPAVNKPSGGGGGGTFDDGDLFDITGDSGYKPDGGKGGRPPVDPNYDNQGGADQPQGPDLPWGQILKMLNANMPEEFYMWMSNLKQMLAPLLERAMDLLQAMP